MPPIRIETKVASGFRTRLRGLARRDEADLEPMLLPDCRSIHTFGMRAPIDVVWVDLGTDGPGRVLGVATAVPPRRLAHAPPGAPQHTAALELPAGSAAHRGLTTGAHITLLHR